MCNLQARARLLGSFLIVEGFNAFSWCECMGVFLLPHLSLKTKEMYSG
uniref:Uncharacterized protein n=1 Tax=Rhizophora mucronata TaxID=61149 RepID=A0A2P2PF13_RHIMU